MRLPTLIVTATVTLVSLVHTLPTRAALLSYTASGRFTNGSTLGGTVTFDTATGTFTSGSLTNSGIAAAFNTLLFSNIQTFGASITELDSVFATADDRYHVGFSLFPSSIALVSEGQAAPILSSAMDVLFDLGTSTFLGSLTSGTLTPTAIPEPASLAVLGLGATGLGVVGRRRAGRHPYADTAMSKAE